VVAVVRFVWPGAAPECPGAIGTVAGFCCPGATPEWPGAVAGVVGANGAGGFALGAGGAGDRPAAGRAIFGFGGAVTGRVDDG
jgi:hypothetical protein